MHATDTLAEADRLMTICNSCRYCEGLCAVFPAMEMRRAFPDGDLNYLANLCHNCGACYHDCQFSPPHEFNVNVPKVLARARAESYEQYAWPPAFARAYRHNGLFIALVLALCVTGFVAGFMVLSDPRVMFSAQTGPGAFFRIMPHNVMATLFGAAFLFAILAIAMGVRAFWRDIGSPIGVGDLGQAADDAARLRYLDGGGVGCANGSERPNDQRRLFHHLTFYGFMLCFAATSVATLYHYLLNREAPYPWYDLPVVFGVLGGLGLILGPLGLMSEKLRRDPQTRDDASVGMDAAFLAMLLAASVTGFALLLLRSTPAMGALLALHLGVVFSLFVTLPYSKFVHGVYRFAALTRYAQERREFLGGHQ